VQSVINKKYGQDATNVGDEGGFAPSIQVSTHARGGMDRLRVLFA
jgi:enolase